MSKIKNCSLQFACILFSVNLSAQTLNDSSFDTNGPIGSLLFPEDEYGNVVFSDIIYAPFSADTLKSLALECFQIIDRTEDANVSDIDVNLMKIVARADLKVGLVDVKLVVGPKLYTTGKSWVDFEVVLEFRNGMYKYTLSHFITDRWDIRGEGKGKGPSNRIHWQRINSINKRGISQSQKDKLIAEETESYQHEYQAVIKFIDAIRTFADIQLDTF